MEGYIVLLVVILILMANGFVRVRIERKHKTEKELQALESLKMPSGKLVPSDEELLSMTDAEFSTLPKDDLLWLINHVGHKLYVKPAEDDLWNALFYRLSSIRNNKGWW